MGQGREPIEITYDEHEHESTGAHLFLIDGEKFWIPKSQMEDWDPNQKTFTIPEWLAIEKGLE